VVAADDSLDECSSIGFFFVAATGPNLKATLVAACASDTGVVG
jgi:hypothetical protein